MMGLDAEIADAPARPSRGPFRTRHCRLAARTSTQDQARVRAAPLDSALDQQHGVVAALLAETALHERDGVVRVGRGLCTQPRCTCLQRAVGFGCPEAEKTDALPLTCGCVLSHPSRLPHTLMAES
jgi:hypothetical protein